MAGSPCKQPPAAHGSRPEPQLTAPRRLPPPRAHPRPGAAAGARSSRGAAGLSTTDSGRRRTARLGPARAAELRQARRPPPLGGAAPQGSPAARPLPRAAAAGRRQPTPPAEQGSARSFPQTPPRQRPGRGARSLRSARPRRCLPEAAAPGPRGPAPGGLPACPARVRAPGARGCEPSQPPRLGKAQGSPDPNHQQRASG